MKLEAKRITHQAKHIYKEPLATIVVMILNRLPFLGFLFLLLTFFGGEMCVNDAFLCGYVFLHIFFFGMWSRHRSHPDI